MIVERRSFGKKVVIVVVFVLLLLVALFLLRGWIRETLVKQYANATYGKSLIELSEDELGSFNKEVAVHGFSFATSTSPFGNDPCSLAYYVNFHETVRCSVVNTSTKVELNTATTAQWVAKTPDLESWLKDHGWMVNLRALSDNALARSPLEIVKIPEGRNFNYVQYTKAVGPVECGIDIATAQTDSYTSLYMSINEYCSRQIKFFGGSEELYSDSLGPSL